MKRMLLILCLFAAGNAFGKVDLVTVPNRETVQVTIYNSADLTLVREHRALTLREGMNKLQFSWANTLIDPTSIEMRPLAQLDKIQVSDLVFPPRVKNLGLWNIDSEIGGSVPMSVSYFASGLSWRAFYMGTLSEDEKTMRLQGYVRITNASGEDYENAQTRLIVGKVNQLDRIADLARRAHPYGSPIDTLKRKSGEVTTWDIRRAKDTFWFDRDEEKRGGEWESKAKAIKKEGLSEYFLYSIAGRETIPTGWSKRLPSFTTEEVPVVNRYKFEEERYGASVVRFLSFENDEPHKLGETPIPGGRIKVYRDAGADRNLAYEGQSDFKYIPIDEEVELNLGAVGNVQVQPRLMQMESAAYQFDGNGNITGWDTMQTFEVEVNNTRSVAVDVEIQRNFESAYWTLSKAGDFGDYEKVDLDTVKFSFTLPPGSKKTFIYTVTLRHGTRRDVK